MATEANMNSDEGTQAETISNALQLATTCCADDELIKLMKAFNSGEPCAHLAESLFKKYRSASGWAKHTAQRFHATPYLSHRNQQNSDAYAIAAIAAEAVLFLSIAIIMEQRLWDSLGELEWKKYEAIWQKAQLKADADSTKRHSKRLAERCLFQIEKFKEMY